MPSSTSGDPASPIATHGGSVLPAVCVDAYNAELRSDEGFLGDRASRGAFRDTLESWRERLRTAGEDPFGDTPTETIGKSTLDRVLADGDPNAAGVVQAAIEAFAQEFAGVIRHLLRTPDWQGTPRIVVGGGLRGGRIGELVIGRTAVLLKGERCEVDLLPIRHDPDEAGLIGCAHLAPTWLFAGHDSILGVDIGGTNIRAGLVELRLDRGPDLARTRVREPLLWRHRKDQPGREQAVERLAEMLRTLIERAHKKKQMLAPFIGIGCPGLIRPDGRIARGGQNLPGDWEAEDFNLPARLREAIPAIGSHETVCLLHNDAVVQGLSEAPFMRDVPQWGVLTIGTGLGNARFTNRPRPP
ncbi:ROK family protein [Rhodovastum atsumiense]|uniref:ROK family protein n=1 Tax=Rhodovastum atsumiense TaxID=504468 RepID=A0A5M6IRH8_9PROT|nr:ROK family protein [Rhodovastum atsumiense]KAA5610791.1 ROK family protein [Rhodovastum atsumiense]CAH2604462.1 ROK family protein [Rhodovastum atsumiense]